MNYYCVSSHSICETTFRPQMTPTAELQACAADDVLFKAIVTDPYHVLRWFLPEKRSHKYHLRLSSWVLFANQGFA